MCVLITGASGYIGSNLARQLVNDNVDVHIIIRPSSKLDLIKDIKDRLNIHIFSGDTQELINIMKIISPKTIFHLASLFIAEHKPNEIQAIVQSNIFFGIQLLEAASNAGVKYFINTGTYWQNYNTSDYCPSNLYAATKQAFEDVAQYYISAFGIKFVTIKLLDTYGPNDSRKKVISVLKRAINGCEKLEMSLGDQKLGLVYITDVIKAFLLAEQYAHNMQLNMKKDFIAAPKTMYILKEVTEVFQQAFNCKLEIDFGKRPYRKREVMDICCNDENILSKINTVELYKGLKKIYEAERQLPYYE